MSRNTTTVLVVGVFVSGVTGALAQEIAACDLHRGSANSRIECLTKMVRSLNERLSSLEEKLNKYPRSNDSSAYVRRSELETLLSDYVRYQSPLAINLLVEPSSSQYTGRCLEAYPGETAVIAHRPCDFASKQELKWKLLPAPQMDAGKR